MAEILSKQYTSVFTVPDPSKTIPNLHSFFHNDLPTTVPSLSDINFTPKDVEIALGDLKTTATEGPDGWSAHLLHNCKNKFSLPIYLLWRRSLDSGDMPEGINLAFISPIFKGGEKFLPSIYRPIALTSHLTKTFERILRKIMKLK